MENRSSDAIPKNWIRSIIIGGISIVIIFVLIGLGFSGQEQTQSQAPTLQALTTMVEEQANFPTVPEELPSATAVVMSATKIAKLIPASSIEEESGIEITDLRVPCMDVTYDSPITLIDEFDSSFRAYRESTVEDALIEVIIPVNACAVQVTFSSPLLDNTSVKIFQSKDPNAWHERELLQMEGFSNTYYAILNHIYIVDPPYWNLEYDLKIQSETKIYWDGTLSLTRTFLGLCWEGSVPDPVTLKCPDSDVLEREPHPDMPTLVPGGIHN